MEKHVSPVPRVRSPTLYPTAFNLFQGAPDAASSDHDGAHKNGNEAQRHAVGQQHFRRIFS